MSVWFISGRFRVKLVHSHYGIVILEVKTTRRIAGQDQADLPPVKDRFHRLPDGTTLERSWKFLVYPSKHMICGHARVCVASIIIHFREQRVDCQRQLMIWNQGFLQDASSRRLPQRRLRRLSATSHSVLVAQCVFRCYHCSVTHTSRTLVYLVLYSKTSTHFTKSQRCLECIRIWIPKQVPQWWTLRNFQCHRWIRTILHHRPTMRATRTKRLRYSPCQPPPPLSVSPGSIEPRN